jgi:hypothetical protein
MQHRLVIAWCIKQSAAKQRNSGGQVAIAQA